MPTVPLIGGNVAYLRGVLSALAAIFLALFAPGLVHAFVGINHEKATGLGAVAGGLFEALLSPWLWTLVIVLFMLFFIASRLRSKILRVVLFWIPTLCVS